MKRSRIRLRRIRIRSRRRRGRRREEEEEEEEGEEAVVEEAGELRGDTGTYTYAKDESKEIHK